MSPFEDKASATRSLAATRQLIDTSAEGLLCSAKVEGFFVASILISDFDDALHARLQEVAAAHDRTPEEEACAILAAAIARPQSSTPRENLADAARRLFGPENGVELDIPPRGGRMRRVPVDFTGH